jgi:hypothetical protein
MPERELRWLFGTVALLFVAVWALLFWACWSLKSP